MLDECTRHDSSCITELLARTVETIYDISMSAGRSMPSTLLLASDNTVREAKNQYVMRYLCNMCARYKFRVTGLLNLRKSHSHDALDQLWGILARKVASCDRFQSPDSVITILQEELARPGLKGWIGTRTQVKVQNWMGFAHGKSNMVLSGLFSVVGCWTTALETTALF